MVFRDVLQFDPLNSSFFICKLVDMKTVLNFCFREVSKSYHEFRDELMKVFYSRIFQIPLHAFSHLNPQINRFARINLIF